MREFSPKEHERLKDIMIHGKALDPTEELKKLGEYAGSVGSETVQRILARMDAEPWYKKLLRYIRLRIWMWRCWIFNRNK